MPALTVEGSKPRDSGAGDSGRPVSYHLSEGKAGGYPHKRTNGEADSSDF